MVESDEDIAERCVHRNHAIRCMSQQQNAQGFPQITAPIADKDTGIIQQPWYQLFRTLWNRSGAGQGGASVPTGMALFSPSGTVPTGWLALDGSLISQADDPNLFKINGSVLPDMRGRMALGADMTHTIGSTGGVENLVLTVNQLPPHSHDVVDPGHHHASVALASTNTAGGASGSVSAGNTADAQTGITLNETGAGQPIVTISPYYTGIWIVKR